MDTDCKLNSCLYECQISHHRLSPKRHGFKYGMFYFYLDLDEIDSVVASSALIERHQWAFYSFLDSDFINKSATAVKAKVLEYITLVAPDCAKRVVRVYLLCDLRICGYLFNPVSMYYCLAENGQFLCAIAEVTNTFLERKLFFLGGTGQEETIESLLPKLFYVSPFSELDTAFDFKVALPGEELRLTINTQKNAKMTLSAQVTGQRVPLTTSSLLRLTLRYPLMSLRVITLIHWQALKLFLKRVPYINKEANPT